MSKIPWTESSDGMPGALFYVAVDTSVHKYLDPPDPSKPYWTFATKLGHGCDLKNFASLEEAQDYLEDLFAEKKILDPDTTPNQEMEAILAAIDEQRRKRWDDESV